MICGSNPVSSAEHFKLPDPVSIFPGLGNRNFFFPSLIAPMFDSTLRTFVVSVVSFGICGKQLFLYSFIIHIVTPHL